MKINATNVLPPHHFHDLILKVLGSVTSSQQQAVPVPNGLSRFLNSLTLESKGAKLLFFRRVPWPQTLRCWLSSQLLYPQLQHDHNSEFWTKYIRTPFLRCTWRFCPSKWKQNQWNLPCYWVHEEEIVVRRARVLAIVHVFLLGCVFNVFDDQLHLFSQIGLSLEKIRTN